MATVAINLHCDLQQPVKVQYIDGNMFSMDNAGNTVNVFVTDGGEPATLGGSVSASVIRSDGATVAVAGTLSGNVASVVMPQDVYTVPGIVSVAVKITNGQTITTVAAFVTNVYQTTTDTVVDPGTIIPSVQNLISQIETTVATIPADYSNLWTTLAGTFDTGTNYYTGQYVTYNGALYRFTQDHAAGSWIGTDATAATLGTDIYNTRVKLNETSMREFALGGCRLRAWNDTYGFVSNDTRLACVTPMYYPVDIYLDANDVTSIMSTCVLLFFSGYTATPANLVSRQTYNIGRNGRNIIKIPANTFCSFVLAQSSNTAFESVDVAQNIKLSFSPFVDADIRTAGAAADAGSVRWYFNPDVLTAGIRAGMELKTWNDTYGFVSNTTRLSYTTPFISPVPLYLDLNAIQYIRVVRFLIFSGAAATPANFVTYTDVQIDETTDRKAVVIPAGQYVCFSLSKSSNRDFTLDDAALLKVSYSPFVDNTLSIAGESADALQTGSRLTAIENIINSNTDNLPAYYFANDYIQNRCATINSNSGVTSGVTFAFITDPHLHANKKHSANLLNYIMKHTDVPYAICGGDINMAFADVYGEHESETIANANEWLAYVGVVGRNRFFQCRGNHDFSLASRQEGSPYVRYVMPQKNVYTYLARQNETVVRTNPNWNFYLIDNESQKVRFFILDEYRVASTIETYFNPEQYNWILENIQNVSGWSFVFVSHQPFDASLDEYDEEYAPIQNLFKAMAAKTTFNYTNATLGIDTHIDFSTSTNTFVCHLCGHTHKDASHVDGSALTIVTGCDAFYQYDDPSTNRVADSITEQLFDVFSIDTTAKTIKACRIGGGSDRTWNY